MLPKWLKWSQWPPLTRARLAFARVHFWGQLSDARSPGSYPPFLPHFVRHLREATSLAPHYPPPTLGKGLQRPVEEALEGTVACAPSYVVRSLKTNKRSSLLLVLFLFVVLLLCCLLSLDVYYTQSYSQPNGKHHFDSYSIFSSPGYTQKPLPAPFNAHRQQLTKLRRSSPLNLPTFTSYFTHCSPPNPWKHSHIVSAPLLTAIHSHPNTLWT
jgi:hypothetical protein